VLEKETPALLTRKLKKAEEIPEHGHTAGVRWAKKRVAWPWRKG